MEWGWGVKGVGGEGGGGGHVWGKKQISGPSGGGAGERGPCRGPAVKTEEVGSGLRGSREPVIVPEQGEGQS